MKHFDYNDVFTDRYMMIVSDKNNSYKISIGERDFMSKRNNQHIFIREKDLKELTKFLMKITGIEEEYNINIDELEEEIKDTYDDRDYWKNAANNLLKVIKTYKDQR